MVRQNFVGTVIKAMETGGVKVRVERHRLHPRVHKLVPFHKNFICVNPEAKQAQLGDVVRITSIKPLNPVTYFSVTDVIKQGTRIRDPVTGELKAFLPDGFIKDYSKFAPARVKKARK
ncbi:hypothetical protein GGF31_001229 [Allomyces arbusculus]|nr:hypothetical protein GGF31_001229 [Allomyces arbusculus]